MTRSPRLNPIESASPTPTPTPTPQRQLSLAFETPVLQGMSPNERASAVTQLALLLLQAAGVQMPGANDDEQ